MSGAKPPNADDLERGRRLKELRLRFGIKSQTALAESAGGPVTRVQVVHAEKGTHRMTSPPFVTAYARVFGLTEGQLRDYMSGALDLEGVVALGRGARVDALATPASVTVTATAPDAVATGGALAPPPSAPARWVEPTARYMNLEVAVRRAAEAGRPYPEHAILAANILMRRDYDPAPEEWAQLLELQAAVADRFEKRERLVLEHEVAAPDAAVLGRGRGKP